MTDGVALKLPFVGAYNTSIFDLIHAPKSKDLILVGEGVIVIDQASRLEQGPQQIPSDFTCSRQRIMILRCDSVFFLNKFNRCGKIFNKVGIRFGLLFSLAKGLFDLVPIVEKHVARGLSS